MYEKTSVGTREMKAYIGGASDPEARERQIGAELHPPRYPKQRRARPESSSSELFAIQLA
jgi:hypothetical protein